MLACARRALRFTRRNSQVTRFARFAYSTAAEESSTKKVADEMSLTPKVQTVLDQILELNMVEIAELSHSIQV
jgi:hypothetical protein